MEGRDEWIDEGRWRWKEIDGGRQGDGQAVCGVVWLKKGGRERGKEGIFVGVG